MIARSRLLWMLAAAAVIGSACKGAPPDPAADPAHATPKKERGIDVELAPAALDAARIGTAAVSVIPQGSTVVAIGTLDFAQARVARIGPLLEGRITALNVKSGDSVAAGAVLATMESLDVGRTRADFIAAVARRERADIEQTREKKLMDQQLTTEHALLEAETERKLADLGVRAASERLRAVGIDARSVSGDPKGMVPSTAVRLTTPIAGEVMDVSARVGQPVRASDTLFVVGSIDELWLEIDIYERDLARVHVGDTARILTLPFPGRVFEGRVDHVHAVVDATKRVVTVRIVLPNPDRLLRPGMSATARIRARVADAGAGGAPDADAGTTPTPGDVAVIPRGAVQSIDGQPFVFIEKRPGGYELRPIEKGAEYEGVVEVVRGLSPGERLVVDGAFILKSEVLREQMGKND